MQNPVQNSAPIIPPPPVQEANNQSRGSNNSPQKNTILTLGSILVFVGIIGITLWLYIQNKTAIISQKEIFTLTPALPSITIKKNTKVYTSYDIAKKSPETVGFLDVSQEDIDKNVNFGVFKNATTIIITGSGLKEIPDAIYSLASLERLEVPSNQITVIPSDIGRLTKLKILNLTGNKIKTLPAEIGNLTQLEALYLTANQLTDLPANISQLKKLKELRLTGNDFKEIQIKDLKSKLPNTMIIFEVPRPTSTPIPTPTLPQKNP